MNKIFEICKEGVLKEALKYLILNNEGNTNPYHSFEHISNVLMYCHEGAEFHNLPEMETEHLLIAAIFHDFDHSAGELKDNANIANAKRALESWYHSIKEQYTIDIDLIKSYIDITEFPYTVESNMLNLPQQILRDADMGSIFTNNWFQTIMLGLSTEIKSDLPSFFDQQIKFMETLVPNTEWFKQKYIPLLKDKIEDLKMYKQFI